MQFFQYKLKVDILAIQMPVTLIKLYNTLRFSCLCLTGTKLHISKCNNFWPKFPNFENFEPPLFQTFYT